MDARKVQCMTCTRDLRACKRSARYAFVLDRDGTSDRPDTVIYAQCAQHYRSSFGRVMAPRVWEYTRVYDYSANMNVWQGPRKGGA